MVKVTESYDTGNRLIIIHNDDPQDGPTVYTESEAKEIKSELNDLL